MIFDHVDIKSWKFGFDHPILKWWCLMIIFFFPLNINHNKTAHTCMKCMDISNLQFANLKIIYRKRSNCNMTNRILNLQWYCSCNVCCESYITDFIFFFFSVAQHHSSAGAANNPYTDLTLDIDLDVIKTHMAKLFEAPMFHVGFNGKVYVVSLWSFSGLL